MLPQAHEPHESHESRESEAPGPRRARHAARSPEVARWPNLGRASRAAIGIVTIALTAAVVALAPNLAAADPPAPSTVASPAPDASSASPAPTTSADPTATPTPTPSADPTATPTPTAAPTQPAPPTARIPLRKGMVGAKVTTAQQRLTWLGYSISKSSQERQLFGDTTVAAVRAFQAKNWLPVTGRIDKRTWRMLTRQAEPVGILPLRCTQARKALCIDKTTRLLRYVVNGKVKMVADARFGAPGMETDEGVFTVHEKSYNHVSSKYHTWMPRAMFFNRDEAVHYSPDFASVGYSRGSHGCVGLRDMTKATWLFDQVPVGTRVYVYWS